MKTTNRNSHPRQNGAQAFRSPSRNGHLSAAFLDGMIKMVAGPCRERAFDRQLI
ncbi:hypothetical protein OZ411_32520 [Bradyrhizobium sp. Arg237L]|uniref:hypothetical protein n=1 Tax=Bradyrhizobium sp. Arg237L TaxID=3003352 RepID=UPI00249F4D87|nr:hypothetical protein [Bradyrhizobium sp. Arg237L]MDI4237539.1 hypothetical protein [Bradyrhizobium sp. Arg237L]